MICARSSAVKLHQKNKNSICYGFTAWLLMKSQIRACAFKGHKVRGILRFDMNSPLALIYIRTNIFVNSLPF